MKKKASNPTTPRGKEDKFQEVAQAIFSILARRGLEGLTHTRVAEVSGVSRAWIYKYIGKDPKDLVSYSLGSLARAFTRIDIFNDQTCPKEVRQSLFRGTFEMLDQARNNPDLLAMYYRFIGSGNAIGEKIREIDREFVRSLQGRIARTFKKTDRESRVLAETLHGLRMGLVHRFSSLKMGEDYSQDEILVAIRRVFDGFSIEFNSKAKSRMNKE